jgi:2-polyprenyl-6-methoxyphenol hydroxylase-like FAD-dependent oxidoreductase
MLDCDVIIAGGGPVGLFLAAELGRRGLTVRLFDDKAGPGIHPAANANSARTMEHFRRLGLADRIRRLGLPGDHPTDVAYFTQLAQYELARLALPSWEQALSNPRAFEADWPTPELPHRCSQLFVERVLLEAARGAGSDTVRFDARVTGLAQDANGVSATVVSGAESTTCRARYLVGCDGPKSTVRKLLDLHYTGTAGEKREFMGGRMAAAYFHAPGLYDVLGGRRAWQYWTLNQAQRALIISIDGKGGFTINVQLREGEIADAAAVDRQIANAAGCALPYTLINTTEWTAGHALVAERMRCGRVFLAGDAAHLFTPTGGLGYNTGIDDAANLAWKLEAAVKGYAGPGLLDSYELERLPAAMRNTGFARQFADSIGHFHAQPGIAEAGAQGDAARAAAGDYLNRHARHEFVTPGVQLGVRYTGSPVVAEEAAADTPDHANRYLPCAAPGHRAPHAWLGDGTSLYDCFGFGFTLLCLGHGRDSIPKRPWLTTLHIDSAPLRALYGADFVLIRPDQHIAWRGNELSGYHAALARALGA